MIKLDWIFYRVFRETTHSEFDFKVIDSSWGRNGNHSLLDVLHWSHQRTSYKTDNYTGTRLARWSNLVDINGTTNFPWPKAVAANSWGRPSTHLSWSSFHSCDLTVKWSKLSAAMEDMRVCGSERIQWEVSPSRSLQQAYESLTEKSLHVCVRKCTGPDSQGWSYCEGMCIYLYQLQPMCLQFPLASIYLVCPKSIKCDILQHMYLRLHLTVATAAFVVRYVSHGHIAI